MNFYEVDKEGMVDSDEECDNNSEAEEFIPQQVI